MLYMEQELKGTFGAKCIKMELKIPDSTSSNLVVFFHGCCGSVYDRQPTTYQEVSELLSKESISTSFFQTSRKLEKSQWKGADFKEFTFLAFRGKTYKQEFEDCKIAVRELVRQFKKYVSRPQLVFVGFSLGGLTAIRMSQLYIPSALLLFGSGTSFRLDSDHPILGKGLSSGENKLIIDAAASFEGKVITIWGTDDDTTPQEESEKLHSLFATAKKEYQIWDGVDHRFKVQNGKVNPLLVSRIKETITSVLL